MGLFQYLILPWPASPSLAPSHTSGATFRSSEDIMGDHLFCGDCQFHPVLSICDQHRGSAQARQWSCGHQVAVKAAGTSSREAPPRAEHSPRWCLPQLSSSSRISFTDHPLKEEEQVMTFGYKFGLEYSLNSELFGYRVLCCASQDISTITNIDAACIYLRSFDRNFIL